jgi:hypothetical protein
MGQPGSFSEPLPRSPNARVLPPSNESGLWSADRPRAALTPEGLPEVFGVAMPTLEDDNNIPDSVLMHEAMCAHTLDGTLKFDRVRKALDRLSDAQHECFALQAYSRCLMAVYTVLEQAGDARKAELAALLRLYRHVDG